MDYAAAFARGSAPGTGGEPPPLLLAPMEVLADRCFRRAFVCSVGGLDEACQEFIRVPDKYPQNHGDKEEAFVNLKYARSLALKYDAAELSPVPLGAQIMGGNGDLLASVAQQLVLRGAPRVDLNCGCPANCVTGKGAGSSLLKDPEHVHACVSAIVEAVREQNAASRTSTVVSVKMRSGFSDTSLFRENLLAAQEAGAAFLTLHPRTRDQGYKGQADWERTAEAKQVLSIPVVGNGDVTTPAAAMALVRETGCDGIMIGRGAVQDPLIYQRIKRCWAAGDASPDALADEPALLEEFMRTFAREMLEHPTTKRNARLPGDCASAKQRHNSMGRIKQVSNYLFNSNEQMATALTEFLRTDAREMSPDEFVERAVALIHRYWGQQGPPRGVLVNHLGGQRNVRAQPPVAAAPGLQESACGH